ncbi:protein-glutamine glutaminase family protein [Bdellovibrio sp. 22V]|uniref:protein-glutamine glutaminase family protein n=1 Tax=Bdellovibrio TaxID=958 RepID=UPI002543D012|nr:protein-glutamine glutaminase family protein [Bdellovibrio sp. 22V]WII70769.1 protein-glutamine glutaminase family protein [Bdellovibrio sp. 22V]
MRIFLFFILSLIVLPAYAIAPGVLCDQAIIEELSSSEKAGMEEICSYAGQYEESALPDKNATSSGKFRDGYPQTHTYFDFFESLNESIHTLNRGEKCDPKANKNGRIPYPTVNVDKTAAGTIPISVVKEEELNKIFADFAKDPKYAFDVPDDGCWARAHIMARELEKKGIRVGKMFIEGTLIVETKNARNGENVVWSYHVAPMVAVETKTGVEMRILDPAMFNKPVPVKTWTDKMLPDEELKEEVSIYTTDRFVLDPLRGQELSAIRNDPGQGRWHMAETVMAERELEKRQWESEEKKAWRKFNQGKKI